MLNDFQELANWSEQEYSALPWRQNRTLYTTLVSEIMLQQTTVGTVLKRYDDFLKIFPDIQKLASASEEELRTSWQGLGYYRRAANLLKASINLSQSGFPECEESLKEIPGIGSYTASAILAIGHDKPALAVDGNLKRVMSRYFLIDTPYEKGLDDDIRALLKNKEFHSILKNVGSRKINEALMDLGRTVCRVKNPLCLTCPLQKNCKALKKGTQEELPVRLKKATKLIPLKLSRYICIEDEKILLYKKVKGEWLENQWEVPTAIIKCDDDKLKQYPRFEIETPKIKPLKTGITKYKIENFPISSCKKEILENIPSYKSREMQFFDLKELPLISTATEKVLRKLRIL
ncbi:MAG: hypothetical protein NE327_04375 [Lentisphaeraceae bacterium]|nr:hypothetical protein [Lentisphaeraceae bacterium]